LVNYAKLAVIAKVKQDADKSAIDQHKELRVDNPCSFFEKVKAHILEEMSKANEELRKRDAATFDRYFLPSFPDEMFLTFGTDSLCRIGLGVKGGNCRVTAIISGPPNGYELSRKEYLCNQDVACHEPLPFATDEFPPEGSCPEEIAVDVISGVLRGGFD
jgi:hypothetical protein